MFRRKDPLVEQLKRQQAQVAAEKLAEEQQLRAQRETRLQEIWARCQRSIPTLREQAANDLQLIKVGRRELAAWRIVQGSVGFNADVWLGADGNVYSGRGGLERVGDPVHLTYPNYAEDGGSMWVMWDLNRLLERYGL